MKKRVLFLASCLALTAVSCADAPKNESSSNMEKPMVAVSEMTSQKEEYKESLRNKNYDNIKLGDSFDIYMHGDIGIYDVTYISDFDKQSDALFEHYIPDYDSKAVEANEGIGSLQQLKYEDDKYFSIVTSIGGFVLSEKSCLNRVLYGDSISFTDNFAVNGNESRELTVGTEKVSVEELTSSSEQYIDDFTKSVDYPNEIRPFTFCTQTIDDGTTAGIMRCRTYYKGLPVFDIPSLNNEYSIDMADITSPTCTFMNGNAVSQFTVTQGFTDVKTEQQLDSIISPEEAMDLTSEKLAGYSDYDAVLEELVYFPQYIDNSKGIESAAGYVPGDTIRLTPYWAIYFDCSWWHETFALVNCITGEVEFVNNVK